MNDRETALRDNCWTQIDRERVLEEIAQGLWRYVARHAATVPVATRVLADLTGLTAQSLDTLRHVHLVLSDEVARFVTIALPELLRDVRPVAPPVQVIARADVRGRIAWGATASARARGGGDRALYVSAAARQQYTTAETRLLVHLLDGLAASCAALRAITSDTATTASTATEGWVSTYLAVEAAVAEARRHRRLRGIEWQAAAATVDLAACRRSPRAAICMLAETYTHYRDLVERPVSGVLIGALRHRALAPLGDDTLYELWALLGAATTFDAAGWTLDAAALAGQAAVPFTYRAPHGHAVARLRFGHTPAHWQRHSRYRSVFQHYGLSGAVRRPDLIVEMQGHGHGRGVGVRRYLLVEVKRTRDPAYIADSIYKVLGYLADFRDVFHEPEGVQALLLLWDGVPTAGESSPAPPPPIALATHRDYGETLRLLLP